VTAFAKGPDSHWEKWGQTDPYYGVLTVPQFSKANIDESLLAEFFASGERHVDHIFDVIRSRIEPDFSPARILDYGCGPARLVIPFCRRAKAVVGIDISHSMLGEGRKNCARHAVDSACLLHVDEMSSLDTSSFDLVHSFIVLQHIPVRRGEKIVQRLIELLADGGVGAIHLTYSHTGSALRHSVSTLRSHVSLLNGILNTVKGQPFGRPSMLMSHYSLNRVFDLLLNAGCSHLHAEFSSDHCGCHGVMLYFKKTPSPLLAQ
jgi:SAM-dependent methyltransferase